MRDISTEEPLTDDPTEEQSKSTGDEKTAPIAEPDYDDATKKPPTPIEDEEAVRFSCQAVRTSDLMAKKASKGRPHASTIGLMPRILRAASLLTDEGIQDTASSNAFSTFREVFLRGSQPATEENQLPSTMFREQHRMAAGLEQPSSKLWYHNKTINAPGTYDRPEAAAAIKWRSEHTKMVTSKVPRVVVNITHGICQKTASFSWYNRHKITFVMEKLKSLVSTFSCKDIVIMVLYRAQTAACRRAILRAARKDVGQNGEHDIFQILIVTTDSYMGSEAPCVIL